VSGETRGQVSGWTVDTLRAYLQALIDERNTRYEQRFAGVIEAQRVAKEAVGTALLAQEVLVQRAEGVNEKRFDQFSTARRTSDAAALLMMPRIEAEQRYNALNEKISEMAARIDRNEGRSGGLSAGWGYLIGAIGAVGGAIGIVFALLR